MATKKKMLQAAAGQASGGAALDITEVFSTYLYDGTGAAQTITNGIDLAGEGGLVWIKSRSSAKANVLGNTVSGVPNHLISNATSANQYWPGFGITSYNSDGFAVTDSGGSYAVNGSGDNFASWTFRKAPKFFDVVTYTGTGSQQNISHGLDSDVGFLIVKGTSAGGTSWACWHRTFSSNQFIQLNAGNPAGTNSAFFPVAPTSSQFTVGTDGDVNQSGATYVAYLFAHNNGDGEFGPDADQDIIKCGSYTGNGTVGQEINLGFEPQFVMAKITNTSGNWYIQDAMRTMIGNGSPTLKPNSSDAEYNSNGFTEGNIELTSTGFKLDTNDQGGGNGSGDTYIYIAIRRGPLAQPESGTEVFAIDTRSDATSNPPSYSANGIVDMALQKELNASGWGLWDRLRGQYRLQTHATNAEDGPFSYANFDHMDGWGDIGATDTTHSWMWKRAPGFFDVVAYTGNATAGRTVPHNLGVAPELMIAKTRDAANYWVTYDAASGPTKFMILNQTNGTQTSIDHWNNTAPTASVFTLGDGNYTNRNATQHIIYLFASLPGISKVGSYTGNGTSQTIDCGFTSGARFVLLKVASTDDDWFLWDSVRGINAGAEPYLRLNLSAAEITTNDRMDPHSSGFAVDGNDTSNNKNGETYIFYAIA